RKSIKIIDPKRVTNTMQQTRRQIIEILRGHKEATIDEIVEALTERIGKITAVTVRHHLEILRGDGLVAAPTVRRRSAPGRPQYVYSLTERAAEVFPNNYQGLVSGLLEQMKTRLEPVQVREILDGVADTMANGAAIPEGPMDTRLDHVVEFLTDAGYQAEWQPTDGGVVLHCSNCPYDQVSCYNREVCAVDERLISNLHGVRRRRISWRQEDGEICAYLTKNGKNGRKPAAQD